MNRKISIILIIILIGFFLIRIRPIDFKQKIELAILEQIDTDFLWRNLRYIPENISERFSFKLFKEKGESKIYCVNYSYKSVFYSFYYGVWANGDINNIKKGFVTNPANGFDMTDLIQIEAFNRIAKEFNWSNTTLIHNFSFFLSNFCEMEYSLPLESVDDYERIIGQYPLSKEKEIILTPILSRNRVENLLNKEDNGIYYYWYYDQGLMKFSYHLVGGEVKWVKSSFVGYLGNEITRI
ncbi:hypothetical protein GCM10011506_30240 [Marivirga lumbricoides]|uniref:Uncharacterized protein n=1 Tax=Marivirga lumbricoides TaxID=1046115 RepID=A0ABQ1MLI1_9BACT|nr:hypothetical protein GCM10011506_30240 [Marivirga lumbricoides]